jgi:hypothetical protein
MATSEERIRILNMVQEGKISAEEGSKLLAALDLNSQPAPAPRRPDAPAPSDQPGRWFRVKITNTLNDKTRVNVRLPVSLIKVGMKMGAKFSPEVEKIDMDQLSEFISTGEIGQMVDIYDEEDGDHIEVFIE